MKQSIKQVGSTLVVGALLTLTGCATVLRGTGHGIGISSQPPGAEVIVDNQIHGVTPVSVKLKRKENHQIVVQMDGYEPYAVMLTRQTSGWVFGNILFGPGVIIGLAVDAIAGGMYTLSPDDVSADLLPAESRASLEEGTLYVVLVPRADPSWQKIGQMTPIGIGEVAATH
jgi:hypothetical protein